MHRNLKPANVLLEIHADSVVPRVADFGLALGPHDPRGRGFAGTPRYAAPEQREDPASVNVRADVWALGCILFELLSGRTWDRSASAEGRGPGGWLALLGDLLRQDPAERPPDASAVRTRLVGLPGVDSGGTQALAARLRPPPSPAGSRETIGTSWQSATEPSVPAVSADVVGRDDGIRAVRQALAGGARLVTVHGPGGIGKTRVAAEAVAGPFVELADVGTAEAFGAAVARGLGLPPNPTGGWESNWPMTGPVVLDGLDRLGAEARASLVRWLRLAPRAAWVVTSCQLVGIPGEHVVEVGPLAVEPAVALFVVRAAAANPAVAPGAADLALVAELVRLLDGIPLAIELAAARIRVRRWPSWWSGRGPTACGCWGPRRRTRRRADCCSAIEAAHEALLPWEQAAFSRDSVFTGGFTLALAEPVVDLGSWPEAPWVVDVLQVLVDEPRSPDRWQRRAPVRAPRDPPGIRAAALSAGARGRAPPWPGARRARRRRRSGGADPRHVQPSRAGRRGREPARGLPASGGQGRSGGPVPTWVAAWVIQRAIGPLEGSIDLGEALLEVAGLGPRDRTEVAREVAESLVVVGRLDEALTRLEECSRRPRRRLAGGGGHRDWGDGERRPGAGAPRRCGRADRPGRGARGERRSPGNRGSPAAEPRQPPARAGRGRRGRRSYAECADRLARLGDPRNEASARANLGYILVEQGRAVEALAQYRAAIAVQQRLGDRRGVAIGLGNVGTALCLLGEAAEARAAMLEALAVYRKVGPFIRFATISLPF